MTDKVCAIVGFGVGVSMGVARAFGREGYALALVARNPSKLTENSQALATEGYKVQTFSANFDPDAIAQFYLTLHKQPPEAWETELVYK